MVFIAGVLTALFTAIWTVVQCLRRVRLSEKEITAGIVVGLTVILFIDMSVTIKVRDLSEGRAKRGSNLLAVRHTQLVPLGDSYVGQHYIFSSNATNEDVTRERAASKGGSVSTVPAGAAAGVVQSIASAYEGVAHERATSKRGSGGTVLADASMSIGQNVATAHRVWLWSETTSRLIPSADPASCAGAYRQEMYNIVFYANDETVLDGGDISPHAGAQGKDGSAGARHPLQGDAPAPIRAATPAGGLRWAGPGDLPVCADGARHVPRALRPLNPTGLELALRCAPQLAYRYAAHAHDAQALVAVDSIDIQLRPLSLRSAINFLADYASRQRSTT